MKEELDNEIQTALQSAPLDREPSEELVRKLRVMAQQTPVKGGRWQPRLMLPLSAAVVAGLAIGVATMMPAKASAKNFDLIVAAAQHVNAFQFSVVSEDDSKKKSVSIAGADGHVYIQTDEGGILQIDPGSMSIYDPDEKTIMRFKFGTSAEAESILKEVQSGVAEGMKEIDLKKMLKEYEEKYGKGGISISPVSRENGHNVYHVVLAGKGEQERVKMTVDATTDLPEALEIETQDGSQNWRPSANITMKYGGGVDPSALHATFPKDAKVQEIDLGSMVGDAMKGLEHLGDAFGDPSKPKKSGP